MKISKYKKKVKEPLRQATLCFLINNDEILLAMKKRGFGKNKCPKKSTVQLKKNYYYPKWSGFNSI